MTSPLLALFARSLREDIRAKLTYFARSGLIIVILLFLFSTQVMMGWSNAPGLRFFQTVMTINCCFIVLAGLSYFSSAITEEKEEMTLGLLRMTNLNPLSILLGKSTSRVLGALLLLVAQFPFTLLAVSLGGVSVAQIVACYCTLGAFIIFLSNLALLCSVVCRRSGAAAALTGVVLFLGFVVVPFISFVTGLARRFGATVSDAAWVTTLDTIAGWISEASPFQRLTEILRTGFAEGPWCWQIGSNLVLGAGCFLLAWAVFDLFCNEQAEAGPARGALARSTSIFRRTGAGRVWSRALAWKDFYFVAGGKTVIAVKFVLYALPFVSMRFSPAKWGGPADWDNIGGMMLGWMLAVLVLEMAFAAARVFRIERQWKTLSSLATLPMSIQQIAYRKILGCLPALIPAATYAVLGALLVWPELSSEIPPADTNAILFLTYGVAQVIFFLHFVAWLSLWMKRGALAAAFGINFLVQFFAGTIVTMLFRDIGALIPLIAGLLFGTFLFHCWIITRLETLAAEE